MGWRFRKSVSRGPLRVTLGRRGAGASIGVGPLRISLGSDGKVRRTVRVPGTGISNTETVADLRHPRQ